MSNWVASFLAEHPDLAGLPVHRRARRSLHLRLPSGEILGHFTGAPCHFEQDGRWLPLDTALQLDTRRNEYGAPGLQVRLSPAGLVRVARDDDPDETLHRQQSTRVVILDTVDGSLSEIKPLGRGETDGDSMVRSVPGAGEHRLRVTETGLRETLTVAEELPGGTGDQWLMIETAFPACDWPDGWVDGVLAAGIEALGVPMGADANGQEAPCRRYARKRGGVQYLYTGVPLSWLASSAYPVVFDPDFAVDSADGHVWGQNTLSHANARATSSSFSDSGTSFNVGQRAVTTPIWSCYRGYLCFDTSSLTDRAPVLQANLALALALDASTYADFDVQIVKQNWARPLSNDNREAAYDGCLAGTLDDAIWRNTAGIATSVLYASGNLSTAWINQTGFTSYSLRSSRDAAGIDIPSGGNRNEYVSIASATYASSQYRPVLQVLYTQPGGIGPMMSYYRRRRAS